MVDRQRRPEKGRASRLTLQAGQCGHLGYREGAFTLSYQMKLKMTCLLCSEVNENGPGCIGLLRAEEMESEGCWEAPSGL